MNTNRPEVWTYAKPVKKAEPTKIKKGCGCNKNKSQNQNQTS
ncbi:hypothetical protein [Peribacillus asahii]|nr:hypothetical protein [Peribacillus asahii]